MLMGRLRRSGPFVALEAQILVQLLSQRLFDDSFDYPSDLGVDLLYPRPRRSNLRKLGDTIRVYLPLILRDL